MFLINDFKRLSAKPQNHECGGKKKIPKVKRRFLTEHILILQITQPLFRKICLLRMDLSNLYLNHILSSKHLGHKLNWNVGVQEEWVSTDGMNAIS